MPSSELDVNITYSQFHLATLAILVILAPTPKPWYWKVFDLSVTTLCGLTGPFAYILLPVSLLWVFIRRGRFTLAICAVLAGTLAVQLFVGSLHPRAHYGLGASVATLLVILADRIILAGLFADQGHGHVFLTGSMHAVVFASLACLLALPVAVFAALRAPLELRMFALTALLIVIAGLASPIVSPHGNQWELLANSSTGERYFFLAEVAWVTALMWAISRMPQRSLRWAAFGFGALAFASGLVAAWRYPPYLNFHWDAEARAITSAQPGAKLRLPIPPGAGWSIDITVK